MRAMEVIYETRLAWSGDAFRGCLKSKYKVFRHFNCFRVSQCGVALTGGHVRNTQRHSFNQVWNLA